LKTRFNSINAKLIILISAILSGTIVVILFSTMWMLNGFQRKTVVQALQRTDLLVNTLVTSKLQEMRVQSSLVGELPILNTAVENGDINTIRDIAKTYKENLGVPVFDIMGRDGKLLTSVGEAFPPGDTVEKELAGMVMESGFVSAVANRGGKLVLFAGAPIGVADDAGGVLLLGFQLDSAFAAKIREFTKSEISFALPGSVSGSSLPADLRAALLPRLAEISGQSDRAGAAGYATIPGYAVRTQTLKDYHGAELGRTVIQMPLQEHQKMMMNLKLLLAGIGALVFAVACAITYRFSSTFTAPIAELVRFAQKLAGGDRDTTIAVDRTDELGNLQESLEKMRVALKELIENMDARIKNGIRHVTNILDNLDSGFLIFDRNGVVQPGYSRISEHFFGESLAGKKVEEILKIDRQFWPNIDSWRDITFNNVLPFKDACALGPSSYERLEGRHIELTYRPINSGADLEGVVLIATDKTTERELFRKFEEEKSRVDLIIKITTNRDAFMDFIHESRKFINELNDEVEGRGAVDVESAFRTMHTLKGNSAMYSCNHIKTIAHEMETDLADIRTHKGNGFREYMPKLRAGLVALDGAVSAVLDNHKALLGEMNAENVQLRRLTVSSQALGILEKALLEGFRKDSGVYRMFMENFVLEPILPSIKKLESAAQSLAERRQKLIKPVRWEGEDVRVRIEHYKRLLAALVHFFRNAVDHGIEEPDVRESAGKDPEGQITVMVQKVEVEDDDPRLRLRMMDDGQGIDPALIRRKIVEKGLVGAEEAAKLDDDSVIQYVFKNGFSTNDQVTDVSGRGVGMDAIAYEAKKLSGRAWVKSQKGKGVEVIVEVAYLA
jgi:two-component system chemotaxis sensor kinase CheA